MASTAPRFARQVQDVLPNLYDLAFLQTHPLATQIPRASLARQANWAIALQQLLIDVVESLRPGENHGAATRDRAYHLLHTRYLQGEAVAEVAKAWATRSTSRPGSPGSPLCSTKLCATPTEVCHVRAHRGFSPPDNVYVETISHPLDSGQHR